MTPTHRSKPSAISFWHEDAQLGSTPVSELPGDTDLDVAIVGAGYTGLWTAYYLAKADPTLRIGIVEQEFVGFGASGRNGGWCSAIFPASFRKIASKSSHSDAVQMQRAMFSTVREIGAVVASEAIDCDFEQGGYVSTARNAAQWARAEREVQSWRDWGFAADDMQLLTREEAGRRVAASDLFGATYTPHCAVLHPAKLAGGLARVVRGLGVKIYENTTVEEIGERSLTTSHGVVHADVIVRATEGYTANLPGAKRDLVPMYSLMVATAPLSDEQWDEIGLKQRETFSDKRHLRIYGQRTADGRLAFGGRGAPYHFGSRIKPEYDNDERVHATLRSILTEIFPVIDGVEFTHAWGGNLGIPRDWYPSVGYDRRTGLAHAGGYVGDGVATAHLAGRTLAAEITDLDDDLRALPWAGRQSPKWEPEPLRWLGVNAGTMAFSIADQTESTSGKPSRLASSFWRLLGH
ncbi:MULTISPECIES: NAD(P)/FAD-dependent oxidoreductase [Nocardioides]|uniref:NAD(P)/FAD-dependent oxidoreductase n=1 Tax=Nocardioides TaxID=1839 RepID=UPI000330BC1B|nr:MULTISPECIES: FAD-dependent oxidoreductase [Nocardioides]EON25527.1 FAD dependent oxidoreductase [Nocardioides sp. CF8]